MVQRGDVVLVDVPYLDAQQSVRRPALVISDCNRMLDVIIAGITSRIRSPLPATHLVIDRNHVDWPGSGLRLDSAIRCDRIFTVDHSSIHRVLGRFSQSTMSDVESRLKTALGITS
jgi:mRNA-degrading endonuclease toxin of MazEF toxin-antitoxin module